LAGSESIGSQHPLLSISRQRNKIVDRRVGSAGICAP